MKKCSCACSEWISVEERLPELKARALIYAPGWYEKIFIAKRFQSSWYTEFEASIPDIEVTHWAEIREPKAEEGR